MDNKEQILKPLKGFNSFQEVLGQGIKFKSKNLLSAVIFSDSPVKEINYGVTIGKRNAKKAVVRNRIKRLLRESLRYHLGIGSFPERLEKIVVIRLKAPSKPGLVSKKDIDPEIGTLLEKINAYHDKLINEKSSPNTDQIL